MQDSNIFKEHVFFSKSFFLLEGGGMGNKSIMFCNPFPSRKEFRMTSDQEKKQKKVSPEATRGQKLAFSGKTLLRKLQWVGGSGTTWGAVALQGPWVSICCPPDLRLSPIWLYMFTQKLCSTDASFKVWYTTIIPLWAFTWAWSKWNIYNDQSIRLISN